MSKTGTPFRLFAAVLFTLVCATFAQAQATRTWVSGVGDDANPCSRTAPCKTFAGAISKTAVNGEIDALDPGGFGAVTIIKSITIDGNGQVAGITNSGGTNAILINFDSFSAANDPRKSVQIRNLSMNGISSGVRGIRIVGGATIAGGSVSVVHCTIEGDAASPGRGIEDNRTNGGKLFVSDTTIQNMSGTAISQINAGSVRVDWTINDVRIYNCSFGVALGNAGRAVVTNSVISGCANAGLYAEGTSEMNVENTVSTGNGTGVQTVFGATMRLSNTTITFNGTAFNGATLSYGNNRVAGNTSAGTSPTAAGPMSNNFGQQ